MRIDIIGDFDKNTLYCTGSLTKLLTTYVALCFLSEKYTLEKILDDPLFFESICHNQQAKDFLSIFQKLISRPFTLHDICSYYAGLPYTFDPTDTELRKADEGYPFKHHSILDENTFIAMCKNNISMVYKPQSKFHYSELSIIFLGYLLEKAFELKIEELYQHYLLGKFKLNHSVFSRIRPNDVFTQDLSNAYDYPSIAILDHGYFCYSNGFYTTLNDMKTIIEHFMADKIFHFMSDIRHARAASMRLMNGLAVEIRRVKDDVIFGYEGLSFSGCNLWAYSTKHQQGYLTFNNSEEEVYKIIYDDLLAYTDFEAVPDYTQTLYKKFITHYHENQDQRDITAEFQGEYHRVNINEKKLTDIFVVGKNFIIIRNPDEITYNVIYVNGHYRIKGKDNIHGAKVGFYQTEANRYMFFDGTLYKKR